MELMQYHPALKFYATNGQKFPKTKEQWETQSWEEFWAADCKTILVDRTVIEGGEKSWEFFRKLYAQFPKVEREALSMMVVSDDSNGTHTIHCEIITKLYADGCERAIEVSQSFIYVLGEADAGKGTMGLQFRELRNYYDMRILKCALASVEV